MERESLNSWQQRLRNAAHQAGLPRFWRWWTSELATLIPAAWRGAIQRRLARPIVELGDGEAVFWRFDFSDGASRLSVAERVSLMGDPATVQAAGRAAVSKIAPAAASARRPAVIVVLAPRHVLRKQLALPAAVEENLAQALAYDLDRHTPFRADQLYFDATVIDRDAAKKTIRVDWASALRTLVDGARRQVEEWGASVLAVVPGPAQASLPALNLIPVEARPRAMHWRRWKVWVPLAAVAGFALAAVMVPLAQKREYAIALNRVTEDARQRAETADALRQQLERFQGDYNFVLAKKYAYPNSVQVLDDVTRILPDDTWLTQFELKTSFKGKERQREMLLRGESANAGKLIGLLEESKLVEQAALRSPTTKIQPGPGEVFDLGAQLRTLPPPSPAPVVPVAGTPGAPLPAAAPVPLPPAAAVPLPAPAPSASESETPTASESESPTTSESDAPSKSDPNPPVDAARPAPSKAPKQHRRVRS